MKKLLQLIILTFSLPIFSDAQTFDWVKRTENLTFDNFGYIRTKYDAFGNVYSMGGYKDSIRFDSANTYQKTIYGTGVYILKTDSNGGVLWINNLEMGTFDASLDKNGNLYIFGGYLTTVDVDPGPNVVLFPPDPDRQSSMSYVVIKINPQGNFIWAKNISSYSLSRGKIIIDDLNNIYIATNFELTVDVDPNLNISNYFLQPLKMVVFKWNTDGNFIWAKGFGQTVVLDKFAINKNRLIITGNYSGTTDFDPHPTRMVNKTATLNSNDPFALCLDTAGNYKWVIDYPKTSINDFGDICFDKNKSIIFSSKLIGTTDFDPGPNQAILTASIINDFYVLKIDSSSKFLWVKQVRGLKNGNTLGRVLSKVGPTNDLYLVSIFKGHYDFDPGIGIQSINSGLNYSIFTLRLDNNGIFKSLSSFSSISPLDVYSFDVGIKNNLIYSGTFYDTVDFDPSLAVYNVAAKTRILNRNNAFLLQYNQCFETYGNLQANDCRFYQSPFSSKQWQTSGVYADTTSNYMGCDSVVSINVQLSNINKSMGLLGSSLASNDFGAAYQWLNCDSNYSVIANETGQLFTPNKNGNYAVELTKNNCKDTSACFSYTLVGQKELSLAHSVLVSPNPSKGLYNVVASSGYDRLIITDLSGRIVFSNSSYLNSVFQIDLSNYENGIYLLSIVNKGERVVKKLVKH